MKRFRKAIVKTITTVVGVMLIITAVFMATIFYFNLDVSKLSETIGNRSAESIDEWFSGEVGNIVVGKPIVVESVSYDRYAYQQLNDDTRVVYDQIYECITAYKDVISISTTDVNVLKNAYDAMIADYGNLFWISGYKYNTYKSGEEFVGIEFEPKYTMNQDQRDVYQVSVDACVDKWLAGISEDASDYEKALYVFETLIEKVDYNTDSIENQNILSVFLYQSTVCQGYADAAWYMLDKLGINSTIISGEANGENHAWNLVYLDNAYYYMDVTWGNSKYLNLDNSTQKRVNYAYLAMTSEELSQTHTINEPFDAPECLSTADNYYVHEGLFFDTFDEDSIGRTFAKYYNNKQEVSIKLSNAELYKQVILYFFDESHLSDYCDNLESIYYILDDNANVVTVQW